MHSQYSGMNYINGNFCSKRSDFISFNPSTKQSIGCFPSSSDEEVKSTIKIAKEAFQKWKKTSRVKRAEYFWNLCKVLEKRTEEITNAISLETGKTLNESRAEVIEALHMAQYCFGKGREACGEVVASELSERDSYVVRRPKGLVAVIAPWNFPFAIGGFWCAGPALIEGNTVVFKPSELTPMIGQITAELYDEAGFPPGVFNLLHGDGTVGEKVVLNEDVDHICFTGSAEVGRSIRIACANSWNKSCSCEMGSKSAVIVMEDADLDLAVSACINSAFKLSGQRCVSSGRILVQRSILEKFKEKFLYEVNNVVVKDPFDKKLIGICSVEFGPLISSEQMMRVELYNNMVREDADANILYDADESGTMDDLQGYFLRPFVYQVEWSDKPYLKEEVFGPHVSIIPFDTLSDAIDIYNDTDYGLALGCITNNFRYMREIRNNCDTGMVYFNLGSIGAESHFPFTGVKKSGSGGSSAAGTFDSVVHKMAVTVNYVQSLNFPQGLK